jgi:Protein of unknown function (DUF3631)
MSTLSNHTDQIARALLGKPNAALSSDSQLRYGTNGSVAVEITGDRAGTWYDHEKRAGGGMLDLIMRERSCDKAAAHEWLQSIGIDAKPNGATAAQKRVAVYIYKNRRGEPIYCVSRWGPLKTFTQHPYDPTTGKYSTGKGAMKGVRLVPYRLNEWIDEDGPVLIAEGEKHCDKLFELGHLATCNPGGAGKFSRGFVQYFADRDVVILPDNDDAGRDHARKVAEIVGPVAASVRILELPDLPPKGDIINWLDAGGTAEQLTVLLGAAAPADVVIATWEPGEPTTAEPSDADATAHAVADGAELLDQVHMFLVRFVAYPSADAAVAHVLWIAHTHLMDAWESTPRIAFLSAEPASGKTRALEVTELLVPRPVEAVNVSPAYLFRKVGSDVGAPTILYDEIDTLFGPKAKENEEIRGLLNAGHRRGAVAGRCVVRGKIVETEEIPAYCAVALAGLGWLPDTIMTRSVVIRMRRRAPGERVEPYRRRIHVKAGSALRASLERWAIKVMDAATNAWPELPTGIEDRNADVWEPLLAVADAAGGAWPERARAAAVTLVTEARDHTPSLGVRLLQDLRTIFGDRDAMRTNDVLTKLVLLDESPWSDMKGKPLNARGLATRLREYGSRARRSGSAMRRRRDTSAPTSLTPGPATSPRAQNR